MTPSPLLRAVPPGLVALRLALGPTILAGVLYGWSGATLVALLTLGVLSDIFDGIIARRIGTATPALRQADSTVDVVFWLFLLAAAEAKTGRIFADHGWLIGALLLSEIGCQALSRARFGKAPATHTYAAKGWGLMLLVGFGLILGGVEARTYVDVMLATGLLVNAEVIAILWLSGARPVDVPSVLTVLRRRRIGGGDSQP